MMVKNLPCNAVGSIPGWGTKIYMPYGVAKKEKKDGKNTKQKNLIWMSHLTY